MGVKINSLTIGIFDGIHIGHRRLISKTVSQKQDGGEAVMLTFEYPPEYYFDNGEKFRGMIYPSSKRKELAISLGIDRVEFLDFCKMKDYSANEFIDFIVEKYDPGSVTVGFNFRFGKGKSGNTAFLSNKGRKYGFKTHIIQPVLYGGHRVSSTLIRHYLGNGEIGHANEILCDGYSILVRSLGKRERIYRLERDRNGLVSPADGIYLIVAGKSNYGVLKINTLDNSEKMELLFETDVKEFKMGNMEIEFVETLSLDRNLMLENATREIEASKKLISFLKKQWVVGK